MHNHLILVVGVYRREDKWFDPPSLSLGIILFPLAECDLVVYMKRMSTSIVAARGKADVQPHKHAKTLLGFFPCLCRVVLFLHAHRLKHRDLKPSNILIGKDDTLVLSDFDIAQRYESVKDAVTYGNTTRTPQYAPQPGKPRGFNRDVISLGFVFLEMATVLFGESIEDLYQFLRGAEKCEMCTRFHSSGCASRTLSSRQKTEGVELSLIHI